jgi:hypothetical protein
VWLTRDQVLALIRQRSSGGRIASLSWNPLTGERDADVETQSLNCPTCERTVILAVDATPFCPVCSTPLLTTVAPEEDSPPS